MATFKEKFPTKFRALLDPDRGDSAGKEILIDPEDVLDQLLDRKGPTLYMGIWDEARIRQEFDRHGIWKRLHALGYQRAELRLDTRDAYEHRLSVVDPEAAPEIPLIEVVLHRTNIPRRRLPAGLDVPSLRTMLVEWMLLQNPRAQFTNEKSRLPGQRYPGLGLSREMFLFLFHLACELEVNALTVTPGHYHNAVIFSRRLHYLRPESEARLRCYVRDLGDQSLAKVSWAFELGCVREIETGKHVRWFVDWQAVATDEVLRNFFESKDYESPIAAFVGNHHYRIDENLFEQKKHIIDTLADLTT